MAKKILFLSFILVVFTFVHSFAQGELYIPRNIQKAYNKGTRSLEGKPGPNYWQNSSNYFIEAEFLPNERKVLGKERIVYFNNSPNTLNQLVIRLYQDIFKKGFPREFQVDPEDIHDGVKLFNLKINGFDFDFEKEKKSYRIGTNLILNLDSLTIVAPKSKVEITLDWETIIPLKSNIRMGTYDTTSFFVAYWYPQIAVYDDIDGWDLVPYTGTVEMYNDFNNYDVKLKVPKNFIVWATGVLQNPSEVFSNEILLRYKTALKSDSIIRIITREDIELNKLKTQDKEKLIYHYIAENVPDFAFALSDHYLWDGSSLIVDKKSGRRSFIAAAYKKESNDFYEVARLAREVIEYFSFEFPQIPYPYPSMTVFNGRGGMEFPMMVNNSSLETIAGAAGLAAHEIAHTYFPFYMGINEHKYAWMDEGFAVMLPFDYQERYSTRSPREVNATSYESFAGHEQEMPLMTPSFLLTGGNSYRVASYRRPGCAYDFLRDMLGKEKFISVMKEYVSLWNGKHPIPYDFFFTFNKYSGENLNWFWNPWFFEKGFPDLSLENVKYEKGLFSFHVRKKGNIPVPLYIKIEFEDSTFHEITETARVWARGNDVLEFKLKFDKNPISINLGNFKIPDVNRNDNEFYFKK